jgi:flagellar hook protein FlgE
MSFQQGLSGLNASSKNLEVIGNNIANANTYGTKQSRAEFSDMYAAAMNGSGTNDIGIGVNLQTVSQQFTQGNISTTENPMDLAINGAGFFQVKDTNGTTMYSRNGQFKIDKDGFIVNNDKMKLLGYPADTTGLIQPGASQALQLPTAGITPKVTSETKLQLNLDSRLATTVPTTGTIDFTKASTYNNATSVTVYDAKGQDVALTYYFQKSATDTWNVYATANGTTVATDANGNPAPITTLSFDPADGGKVLSQTGDGTLTIPASTNAAGAATLPITGVKLELDGATQFGSPFNVTDVSQDGYTAGQLSSIAVGDDGIILARYSNGQSKAAGQLELANFRNVQGLQPVGGNVWAVTPQSGNPVLGTAGNGKLGLLQSGALEESNVDLTAELVNMITAQRSYQANAQTIKTQDQVLQTLVNLR